MFPLISQSDMYSVGVLAFELFQPFGTEMERARTLEDLREGNIPDSFCQRWPILTKYIMKLISPEPSIRPTASQLLQSDLFYCKDIVCSYTLQKTSYHTHLSTRGALLACHTHSKLSFSINFDFISQVIHGLQRRIEEQEEEITQLRRRISQLQSTQVAVNRSELDKT